MKAQHHWQPLSSWAATLFLAGSLVITGALAAQASTKPDSSYGCVSNSFGYCGSQQFALGQQAPRTTPGRRLTQIRFGVGGFAFVKHGGVL